MIVAKENLNRQQPPAQLAGRPPSAKSYLTQASPFLKNRAMFLERHRAGLIEVITLPERLDASVAESIRDELRRVIGAGSIWLLLDVSAVEFIDSSGLSVFITALKQARLRNGDAALVGVGPSVRSLLELTKVHRVLAVYDDEASALELFGPSNQN
jgi:anti-anti-sigma factor